MPPRTMELGVPRARPLLSVVYLGNGGDNALVSHYYTPSHVDYETVRKGVVEDGQQLGELVS